MNTKLLERFQGIDARRATVADLIACSSLYVDKLRADGVAMTQDRAVAVCQWMSAMLTDPDARVWVVEQDGKLVAQMLTCVQPSQVYDQAPMLQFFGIHVTDGYSGPQCVAGMMRSMVMDASARGISKFQTCLSNPQHVRLTERLGMKPVLTVYETED